MADVKKFQSDGKEAGKVALPDSVFGAYVRTQTVQQCLLRQLGNARRAHPCTMTKGDVAGTGKRPHRQKGTGRARSGSARNPHWRGGGVAHGPDGRNYTTAMNKKSRRKAVSSLLTKRARSEELCVIQPPTFEAPKTRKVTDLVKAMGFAGQKILFVTSGRDLAFERSVRNIPTCKVLLFSNLNPHDLLNFDQIVVFEDAVEKIVAQLTAPRRSVATPNVEAVVPEATGSEEAQS